MKLGELITQYRLEHDLSQRQFAISCGLSNGYISMLERGFNPATGKPVTPTIPQLQKLANGMSLTVMDILEMVDDMPIDLNASPLSYTFTDTNPDKNIIRIAGRDGSYRERHLTDEQMAALKAILDQMPEMPEDL